MTTQDGPPEIDRKILVTAMCLYCQQRFATVAEAKVHDATCPEHPAVRQLAEVNALLLEEMRLHSRTVGELDAAVQQLAVAKRFIASIIDRINDCTIDVVTVTGALLDAGMIAETHAGLDPRDPWYVLSEAWRV